MNNKGGRAQFGYLLTQQGVLSQSTSILLIEGNSFENQSVGAVRLTRTAGASAIFYHVVISGNEFAGAPAGNAAVELDGGQDFISNIVVTNNVIQISGTGISAFTAKGIYVGGNVIQAFGAGSVGIQTSGSATGNIGFNTFVNVETPIANTAAGVTVH